MIIFYYYYNPHIMIIYKRGHGYFCNADFIDLSQALITEIIRLQFISPQFEASLT